MRFDVNKLKADVCRKSFFHFVKEFWNTIIPEKPVWNWHIEFLCNEMQEMAERVFRGEPKKYDMVINIPPGTSKSSVCSVFFAPWTWTRMPSARHINCSYSFPLAVDLGRKSRDVVLSEHYKQIFPEIILREDQNTKHYFQNTMGGTRYSVGANGSVTGMHGHFITIDDPLDPNQAASEADRKATNNWIQETLPSRKVDKAVTPTTLIMQRLHQDDPTSLFLTRKGAKENVRHICLPAEATEAVSPPEVLQHYAPNPRVGEKALLDPVRLSPAVLDEYKALGDYIYSSQFLESPIPPGGGFFKTIRLRYGSPPKRFVRLVRGWDKAGTSGGGAFTVGVKMGVDEEGRTWVLNVKRFQEDSATREQIIKSTAEQDGKHVLVVLEQEGGSGGKGDAEASVRRLRGFRVKIVKVGKELGSKIDRAGPLSVQVNEGQVWLPQPEDAPWVPAYVEELMYFPHGTYMDQVDASSNAFNELAAGKRTVGCLRM